MWRRKAGEGSFKRPRRRKGFLCVCRGKRQKNPFAHSKLKGRDKTPACLLFDIQSLLRAAFLPRHQSVSAPQNLLFVFAPGLFRISLISTVSARCVYLSLFLPLLPTPRQLENKKKNWSQTEDVWGSDWPQRGRLCCRCQRRSRHLSGVTPEPIKP